jgi:23S rRNA pseudouridine1911/1915/1917 synthase
MASLGCPIMGDRIYGGQKASQISEMGIPRMMLHARRLGFQHPVSAIYQEYTSEPQADFVMIFQALQAMTSRHCA